MAPVWRDLIDFSFFVTCTMVTPARDMVCSRAKLIFTQTTASLFPNSVLLPDFFEGRRRMYTGYKLICLVRWAINGLAFSLERFFLINLFVRWSWTLARCHFRVLFGQYLRFLDCKTVVFFALVCQTNARGLWTKGLERVWKLFASIQYIYSHICMILAFETLKIIRNRLLERKSRGLPCVEDPLT